MKRRSKFLIGALPLVVMMFTGCISSRSNAVGIEASARFMASPEYEVFGEAEGISSSFSLFWWIPVTPAANTVEAVDDAIKIKGGDNLIEAAFTSEKKIYIVGSVTNIYVKGKVIRYLRNEKFQQR